MIRDKAGANTIKVVLVLLAIVLLGTAGYFITRSVTKSATTAQSVNLPAGWKSANLKYEKLNLRYPPNWKIHDTSIKRGSTGGVSPGSDQATLTSPDSLTVTVNTGVLDVGNGLDKILAASPIRTLDGNYYLEFYTNSAANPDIAQGACVATQVVLNADYPYSRNISSATKNGSRPTNAVCITYPQDSEGYIPRKSVSDFRNDPSFSYAKLIIQSLRYY